MVKSFKDFSYTVPVSKKIQIDLRWIDMPIHSNNIEQAKSKTKLLERKYKLIQINNLICNVDN